jgi:tetratricopeptide (TPR) repeat protein
MKNLITALITILIVASCKNENTQVVSAVFVDSLLNNYSVPAAIKINDADVAFWSSRITANTPDYSNTSKYAAALIARFHLSGNIKDLKKSDSLLQKLSTDYNAKEVGPLFSLIGHAILQHRFKEADSLLIIVKKMGIKKYESAATSFDVDFELGRMMQAKTELKFIQFENDFGYQFRKSKMMHYNGELDSSVIAMQKAVENAGQDISLKLSAISNVGDLYLHAGKMDKAYQSFLECININPADLHSIMGIGWIALVKDKNDSLAERIFQFVAIKTQSPEPLFKLIAVAQQRSDSISELKYAKAFEQKVTDTLYGNMYNKYLIQLYTGILNNPAKAEVIAKAELQNRSTPQTFAWYAWSLICNNKKEEAYRVYKNYVSGKPLEGLELYWMGKLNLSLKKGYNATQYLDEAAKNLYDLNPAVVKDLAFLSNK